MSIFNLSFPHDKRQVNTAKQMGIKYPRKKPNRITISTSE